MQRKLPHILVVDDDPTRGQEVMGILRRREYPVDRASTVEEAYALLLQKPVALVVAGIRVGSLNGLQLIVSCRVKKPEVAGMIIAGQPEDVPEMDAWRHGITAVFRPLDADRFLMVVAEKLASIRPRQRWPRKKVTTYVPMHVQRVPARLLDVSYGGLRFQLQGESYGLKSPIRIEIPVSRLAVDAELVWSSRALDGATCLCGVMLTDERGADHAWRAFVDRVS